MVKALIAGVILGLLLAGAGVYFYFSTGRAPVAVTDPAMPFEKRLTQMALDAHLDNQTKTEPTVPLDEPNLLEGARVYKEICAVCHGLPGESKTAIAQGMYPPPPQLFHGTGVTDDPVWETYWKAKNGIRMSGMPAFQERLTEAQLWQVSQLVANADKISTAVRAALASAPGAKPVAEAPMKH